MSQSRIINGKGLTLPAGDYYIGDPCYAIKRQDWANFRCAAKDNGTLTFGHIKIKTGS